MVHENLLENIRFGLLYETNLHRVSAVGCKLKKLDIFPEIINRQFIKIHCVHVNFLYIHGKLYKYK